MGILTVLCIVGVFQLIDCQIVPSEPFPNSFRPIYNSDQYVLFYKHDDKNATFEVWANSTGYAGFGISRNGDMKKADIAIGWIQNGQPVLKVCLHIITVKHHNYFALIF